MNYLIKIIITISFILITTSNLFAGVTATSPATSSTLSQIASATSFTSATNNNLTTSQLNQKVSASFDRAKMKADIQATAKEYGLKIDQSAIAALEAYGSAGKTQEARVQMLTSAVANVTEAAADQTQTTTKDTWIYTSDELDIDSGSGLILTKTTSYNGSTYSSANDVFDNTAGAQRFWANTYVDFRKKTIWADVKTKITYADGSGTVKTVSFTTTSGAIESTPIVAEANWAHTGPNYNGANTVGAWDGTGFDSSTQSLQKANGGGFADSCCGDADTDLFRWYNHQGTMAEDYESDKSAGEVYTYAKIVIPSAGASADGIIAFEGSNCTISSGTCAGANDAAKETAFINKLERYQATVNVTAKKVK